MDSLGRPTQKTDPVGNVDYMTYDDVNHEWRRYPGWHAAGTNYATTGPVEIYKHYLPNGTGQAVFNESLTAVMSTQSSATPTGHEALASIQSLLRAITNVGGQVTESRAYFAFSGTSGDLRYVFDQALSNAEADTIIERTLEI